jgi:hypothetical protein
MQTKNPPQRLAGADFALALAALLERPQADAQIGAVRLSMSYMGCVSKRKLITV